MKPVHNCMHAEKISYLHNVDPLFANDNAIHKYQIFISIAKDYEKLNT